MSRGSKPGTGKTVSFSKTPTPAVGPTEPPDQRVLNIFSRGNVAGRGGFDHLTPFTAWAQNE